MEKAPRQAIESPENASPDEEAPFHYELLKGHFEPDGTWKSSEELRMQYLHLTDKLIQTMTKETEIENPETGEMELRRPSVVVFLDKSARPLSHLVREMWPTFAKDQETGEVPPLPAFKFLNIDREKWVNEFDPKSGRGVVNVNDIHPSIVRGLRSIFLTPEGKEQVIENGLTEAVDTMPTILDDESVLIVDETYSTGNTAKVASGMLQRAVPSARVSTAHWMQTSFPLKNGNIKNGTPVWYDDSTILGRGVGNRYADSTRNQNLGKVSKENYYRTIGRWFLSSPLQQGPDELYLQLIREFKELAANPDVPVMPSFTRDDEDLDNRLISYNYRDINSADLSETERESLIANVVAHKNAIHATSKKEKERLRVSTSSQKRR